MAGEQPIIVVKRIIKAAPAHHGGAWKVAYADFVTAMMAFFLLMWLINVTSPDQKQGIADYFAPQHIAQTVGGSGGVLGGRIMGQSDSRAGGTASNMEKNSPRSPNSATVTAEDGQVSGGVADSQGELPKAQGAADTNTTSTSTQNGEFVHAAESIRQSIQDNPDIANLSQQVIMDNTPEGLRIQLVDQDGRPMFRQNSAEPMPYTKKLLATIAKIVNRLPNRISISGHTQAAPFAGPRGETNWELSAARANAGRAALTAAGLGNDRIYEVAGKAGSEPLLPDDPNASANRRLSITLLREAPPMPIGHRL
jgi:chemotaxis protein MotB